MNRFKALSLVSILIFAGLAPCFVYAETVQDFGSFSAVTDWEKMSLDINLNLDISKGGFGLPIGRSLAEKTLALEYISAAKDYIYTIQFDSSSTIADLVQRSELSTNDLDDLVISAKSASPVISRDMQSIRGFYTINLNDLSAKIAGQLTAADFPYIFEAKLAPDYTGIVIIVQGKLPIHGKFSEGSLVPCLFPKIWDSDMNLLYDKNKVDSKVLACSSLVHYQKESDIFSREASGMSGRLREIAGDNPLKIIATGLFGVVPTDIIIDRTDAATILSSENNKNLLRQGRVVIINGVSE